MDNPRRDCQVNKERLSSCQAHENPRSGDSGDGNPDSIPDLPEYLMSLALQATEGKSPSQKREIIEMLNKHQRGFSKDEYDLGLNQLASHAIDTGDARPGKQGPIL